MTEDFVSVRPDINRDQWGRPLVVPPGGGNPTAYTRCTTFVGAIEDTYNLSKWQMRMVALGLADRPDLLLSVASHRDDKSKLNKDCDDALEAAKGRAAATTGTALHALCELIDTGRDAGVVPAAYVADLAAYTAATVDLKPVQVEQFSVLDNFKIGGTPDRVVEYGGKRYISDIKGLALTTPIPTPSGWSTMGNLKVGDQVFAADGSVCNVVVKSNVKRIGTHIVTFDDGSRITCDTEHIWWTTAGYRRTAEPTPKPIGDIIATLHYQGQAHHRVPVAGALNLPDLDLPIDPYLLGCWLGDGHRRDGCITKGDDLFDILLADGHRLGVRQAPPAGKEHVATRTVVGLNTALNALGLRGHKMVPDRYLRASRAQRLRLLQGLMDTDGTWNTARRTACFTSTDKALSHAVQELAHTLGQRARVTPVVRTGFGVTVTAYDVEFTPVGLNPFRLPRKADQAEASEKSTMQASRRVIVSVEPGPDVDTACIGVDSANHTYLCGEHMIPTHNTGSIDFGYLKIAAQLAVYSRSTPYDIDKAERLAPHDADTERGIIVHLPAGTGRCDLYWVDLVAGWEAVKVCKQIRDKRSIPKRRIVSPLDQPFATSASSVSPTDRIAKLIAACKTKEATRTVWRKHAAEWNDDLTAIAKAHISTLLV